MRQIHVTVTALGMDEQGIDAMLGNHALLLDWAAEGLASGQPILEAIKDGYMYPTYDHAENFVHVGEGIALYDPPDPDENEPEDPPLFPLFHIRDVDGEPVFFYKHGYVAKLNCARPCRFAQFFRVD